MKIKRQKTNKRHMAVYLNSFGFREPYQCLVDGNFMAMAMHMGAGLDEILARVLTGPTKPMTTSCIQTELRKLGPDYAAVVDACESLERRRCQHAPAVPAAKCITEIIGEKNQHNYCVATQDTTLRRALAAVPGTPLVYINRSVVILEPPSGSTTDRVKEIELGKTLPQKFEKSVLHKPAAPVPEPPPHKKKPKAPNPLSVKKKKPEPRPPKTPTDAAQNTTHTAESEMKAATKTKRPRLEEEAPALEPETDAVPKDDEGGANHSADEPARKKRKRRKKSKATATASAEAAAAS
ncbi:hypothetical protein HDU87_004015 [Geranomyces variabilis]|uniref:U three protein 23 n=1 Tax=Geranomyces variabilis TaxID=109894 RepID=A0AAD5TRG5_9FUNG|nr:hypothetical protein HDU87_004015 [Geranomyces variabilis]